MTIRNLQSIFKRRFVKYLMPCLFAVLGLFLLLPNRSLLETDIFIPLDYRQIPAGLAMKPPSTSGVEARINGPKSKIKTLSDLELRYEVDLSAVTIGFNSIAIEPDQIQLPSGFSVVSVNPAQVAVRIEREIEKELPVKIALSGSPVNGYKISGTIARPLSVKLRGPETAILPMEDVLTKPIDIKGLSESFKKEIPLDLPQEVQVIDASNVIFAEVLIEEKITVKKIVDIVVKGTGTPYVYSINPPTIDVAVKGPANITDRLDKKNNIDVYVDLQGLTPGVYIRRATITLPVKTSLVSVKPEIFTIKISNKKSN